MTMTKYDDSLTDDACDSKVLCARNAGRAWAEREWDSCNQDEQRGQLWYPSAVDARTLVDDLDADDDDHELADICNRAATARWNLLSRE